MGTRRTRRRTRSTQRIAARAAGRWSVALAIALGACGAGSTPQTLLQPGPETVGAEPIPTQPYIVRMSDGRRDWEVEFPEVATGYEIRIPLTGAEGHAVRDVAPGMTDADQELVSELRRGADGEGTERAGVFGGGRDLVEEAAEGVVDRGRPSDRLLSGQDLDGNGDAGRNLRDDQESAPSRPSYLLGASEIRRLYRAGNIEVAMVKLSELLRFYPDDVRLLSMKGTLWLRLGRPELAREAWEEVLRHDPENRVVQQSLERLGESDDDFGEGEEEEVNPLITPPSAPPTPRRAPAPRAPRPERPR